MDPRCKISSFSQTKLTKRILLMMLVMVLACSLICQAHAKGQTVEVLKLENEAFDLTDHREQIMMNTDIVKVLDQVGCCKLKNSAIKLTSNITVNGTPFQLVKLLSVRCKDDQTSKQDNEYCLDDNRLAIQDKRIYVAKIIEQQQKVVTSHKRHLAGVVDPTKCTATGTGVSTFNTNTQVTITVTAKDSSGTNVGVGNEVVFVEITNACTKGNNYECVANADRQTVLTSDIVAQMTDNHDGTYTYNYNVTRPGQITVSVLHYTNGGVYQEYFPNTSESGDNASNSTISQINFPSSSNDVYPGRSVTVSGNFYFRFKAPITGTLTFYINIDDNTSMSVENVSILSGGCCSTYSGTYSVVKNQYYRAKVTFSQGGGPWNILMYWSYPSGQTLVPSTSLYYPTYITSAPIQVTVTCPSGYSTSTSAGYPQCVTTCGDGYRAGSEACDDSNTTPNDGCSATCTVESGYTCTGGSGTSRDTCSKSAYSCPSGYTCTGGSCASISDCSQTVTSVCSSDYNLSSFNRWMALGMWSSVIICFIVDMIISCVTDKYPSGLYTCLEHIQLFTILPLAGSCFSTEVNGFFRLSRYSLLSFDFINIKQVFYISSDYNQDNRALSLIGFSSSSTIINIGGYLIIWLCIMFIEMLVFKLFKSIYKNLDEKNININGCAFKTSSRLKKWMPCGAPIRYLLLGLVLINTAGIDELDNYSNLNHRWSWWLACFILFVFSFMISCTVSYAILTKSHQDLMDSNVFAELVNGLKSNLASKLYSLIFMIHRILIVMFVTINMDLSTKNKLISLICIQSTYLISLLFIRPFSTIRANFNKIVLESSILMLLCLMLSYSNSSDWSSSTKYVFVYLMVVSSCIPCLVCIIMLVPEIILSKKNNRKATPIHNQIHISMNDSRFGLNRSTFFESSQLYKPNKDNLIKKNITERPEIVKIKNLIANNNHEDLKIDDALVIPIRNSNNTQRYNFVSNNQSAKESEKIKILVK